ncbi:MAG: response regulator transcription factor [Acidimicrobiaceae bacterium]|nr:response regulator transcription factor [Acidimicrobiaceae bacterium]
MAAKVLVVSDDDVNRTGLTAVLAAHAQIETEVGVRHDQAASHVDWARFDVVIVDADDAHSPADQFPGVATVETIRRHQRSQQTKVVALTNEYFHDALRIRMREAGADTMHRRATIGLSDQLYRVVLAPLSDRDRIPDPWDLEQMVRIGVSRWSRVNAGVRFIKEHPRPLVEGRVAGRRSRAWLRWRGEFNKAANLNPVTADGRPPERNPVAPSLPQIFRFYQWATRFQSSGIAHIRLAS